MNIFKPNIIYFIGIGGIGMSALARYFKELGKQVSGYDKTPSEITDALIYDGIHVSFNESINELPSEILAEKNNVLVVYTPAIPAAHEALRFFKKNDFAVLKRSEVLGMLTQGHFTVAVAGTHGKTSTSAMIAHMLTASKRPCLAFLGGVAVNFNSNFINTSPSENEKIIVTEADEFDKSFLQLNPSISVITSTEPDHLDVYGTAGNVIKTYSEFAYLIRKNGRLCLYEKAEVNLPLHADKVVFYGQKPDNDFYYENLKVENGLFVFDLCGKEINRTRIELQIPGTHNVLNALGAISALNGMLDPEEMAKSLKSFRGVKRRFEIISRTSSHVFVDDYAHHPTEIESALKTARMLFPGEKITAIFQPHLYTRTRDFAEGFVKILSAFDKVILLDIYPARELPIPGVDSQMILDKISHKNKILAEKASIPDLIQQESNRIIMTIGAGDIDRLVPQIKAIIEKK